MTDFDKAGFILIGMAIIIVLNRWWEWMKGGRS